MQAMIEVRGLTKTYKETDAVKGISFDVEEGEIFGFLGPNGAGKSTTINMICTMLKPTSGNILINGYDVSKEKNRVRESIGLIFQQNTLDTKLTANENLKFHCRFYNVPKNVREERIQEVLEIVDLTESRYSKVETFSGGMQRRLEIARGLLHYPRVLFLDEPTVGLDPQTRAHLWEYILKLKKEQGITMFLTTHYLDEAEISDRVAIMDKGKIIAVDPPSKLKDQLGGDIIELSTNDNNQALKEIHENVQDAEVTVHEGTIHIKVASSDAFISSFLKSLSIPVTKLNIRKPTLNDVFMAFTGRNIGEAGDI
ncbi:ABC-2 type transport system ATP-binding protein [Salisediminibacterium halotolerans]|uniref:ABC-2 type transport system ATP-binding protein n=2 Tax=Salisediminibacterium halotolerans TaxID=517425 RepID=A0A1H9WXF2_9BACI|nr:ATP-binding cassette domain-containing protein [Salisediminibacterium haloalkalitolerans]SES38608.1 ABC-2 type transport system ATP-binding protein [Salisediminibacterium haloalkalitolerans]